MLPLASFGPIAVSVFGPASTAVIWLGSSLSCSYAAMIAEDHKIKQAGTGSWKDTLPHKDTIRHDTTVRHIGASGSVLGIISASACVFPKQKMYIFPLPLPVRLYAALGAFGIGSAYCWAQGLLPSIGHTGHLGGMAFGIAYYFLALKWRLQMEAIGLAAGIVQLVGLTTKTIKYLNGVKHSSEERTKLFREASSLLPLLVTLQTQVDQSKGS
ncbi:MAG: hypothetical protein Q9228_006737 [Teloschistes exilis]